MVNVSEKSPKILIFNSVFNVRRKIAVFTQMWFCLEKSYLSNWHLKNTETFTILKKDFQLKMWKIFK